MSLAIQVGSAAVVGFLGFLGHGVGGVIGDYHDLPWADTVGLITMVAVGALIVLRQYVVPPLFI